MPFSLPAFALRRALSRAARRPKPRAATRPRLESLEERVTPVVTDLTTHATFATIQAAVNAANAGDIIRADAGTYAEQVTINKPLTLQGANHGISGTSGSRGAESIVDGTTNGGKTPFFVTANGVTIDGFTVQGATSSNQFGFGIDLNPGTSGSLVENNIIQNNIAGLALNNDPNGNPTVIRDNLFRNNDAPGPISGTAIYTDQFVATGVAGVANVVIDSNTFSDNTANANAGVNIAGEGDVQSNITVSNNFFTTMGNGVLFFNTTNSSVTGNTITGSLGTQVGVFDGSSGITISNNIIANGQTRGVRIDNFIGAGGTNSNVTVSDDSISGNATAGLEIGNTSGAGYAGTLSAPNDWWGSPTGPTSPNNPGGTGDKIIDPNNQVNFSPFLISGANTAAPGQPGFYPPANGSNAVVVNGSAGNTTVVVTATGPNSGSYTVNNGTPVPFSNITSFTFIGGNNDVLTINNPAGGLFAPSGGIAYDGSGTGNSLKILGGAAVSETFTYNPNTGTGHNGAVVLVNGSTTADYTYSDLSPVLVNAGTPTNVVFNLPNNAQDNKVSLTAAGAGMSEIQSLLATPGFEATTFANPGASGTVTINVTGTVGQTLNVQALAGGAVLHVNGIGSDTLNFNAQGRPVGTHAGSLTSEGVVTVVYSAVARLNLQNAVGVDAAVGPDTADRGTAFVGLTANERFVQAIYLDDLGRAGAKSELDFWAAQFSGSGPNAQIQSQIAAGVEHSQEGRDHLVKSWYQTFLGRAAQGDENWAVNLMLEGQTEEQVLSQLLASSEFGARAQTLTGNSNAGQAYVQALYLLLLNRAGSSSEVASWVNVLPSLGRQGVALDFLQSSEFRTSQFEGYYDALLHRPSDSAGLNSWVMSNLGIDAVRIDFEATGEFYTNG